MKLMMEIKLRRTMNKRIMTIMELNPFLKYKYETHFDLVLLLFLFIGLCVNFRLSRFQLYFQ